ncbi:hypothetical protein N7540_003347 [Penicillium herquei]|nr:hypothetical protein N7540_003347 [Penicillium herquei]
MSPPAAQWPALSGGQSTAPADTTRRLLNINHDVKSLLQHISDHNGLRVPSPVVQTLRNVEDLTTDLIRDPLGASQWGAQFARLQQDNTEIRKDLTAIRLAQEAPVRMSTASYAAAARGAPTPAHYLSSHSSTSSAPATPPAVKGDRELTVRLNDSAAMAAYHRETAASMVQKINKLRAKLVSGDLRITVRSAREAELMRTHREWVASVSRKAELLLPTWGVVIHDMNMRSMGVNSPRVDELKKEDIQKRVIDQLVSSNRHDWGESAEITRIFWLRAPIGKKSGSLVAEFTSPIPANTAIDHGVLWDGNCLHTMVYDRAIRVRQCHTCQKWGHIGTTCPNKPICVHCAGPHPSRECAAKLDGTLINKCSNCGGTYAAWAKDCPTRMQEVEKMQALAVHRSRYHPVLAYISAAALSMD